MLSLFIAMFGRFFLYKRQVRLILQSTTFFDSTPANSRKPEMGKLKKRPVSRPPHRVCMTNSRHTAKTVRQRAQMRHPPYHQSCRYKDHSGSVKGVRAEPDTAPQITLNPLRPRHFGPTLMRSPLSAPTSKRCLLGGDITT